MRGDTYKRGVLGWFASPLGPIVEILPARIGEECLALTARMISHAGSLIRTVGRGRLMVEGLTPSRNGRRSERLGSVAAAVAASVSEAAERPGIREREAGPKPHGPQVRGSIEASG